MAGAGVLLVAAHLWGVRLVGSGHTLLLGWPPFFGRAELRLGVAALPALTVGLVAVGVAPRLARHLPWGRLLVAAMAASLAWAVALALVDGWSGLSGPLTPPFEYLHDVPSVGPPLAFLRSFTSRLGSYSIQVQGHPPGLPLALSALHRIGLGGPGWAAALLIGVGATATPAALMALRDTAGEARARVAAPYLCFAPAWVWVATSGDALFMGVGAWAVTLLVMATGRRGSRSDLLGLLGGLLLGAALFLTYGAVLLTSIPVVVGLSRHRIRPLLAGAFGVAAVVVAFAVAGFWWLDGLAATRSLYAQGIARTRPYGYFVVANLALFAVVVGPAALAGLAFLRGRETWLLVAGGLLAVGLADLSGLSKGEVERIWLLFFPWVGVAAANIAGRDGGPSRPWLAAQIAAGLAVQVTVLSPW